MPTSHHSNRFVGITALIAVVGLGTVWQFLLKPIKEQAQRAKQYGVLSSEEAIPTLAPGREH